MKQTEKNSPDGCPAFTLVELLVVIGIMSLLGSIGFSGIQAVRKYIDEGRGRALLMEIQTACRLYYMDHAGWPVSVTAPELELTGEDRSPGQFLAPYMETVLTVDYLDEEFKGRHLYLVLDLDWDHWIHSADFSALGAASRPGDLWDHAAVYCLDSEGILLFSSWE